MSSLVNIGEPSFLLILAVTTGVALFWYHLIAGFLYFLLYVKKKGAKWKTQLQYPTLNTTFHEAYDGSISLLPGAFNAALCFYFSFHGIGHQIIHWHDATLLYHVVSIFMLIATVEIFEWWFHWYSHRNRFLWKFHKKHHQFPNPTPYTVLSDHPVDMWVKSSPLVWVPFLFPISSFVLVGWFAFVNFVYGTYLHAGFEFPWLPNRHTKYLLSSWHHNIHHLSKPGKNYGFFTGIMDIIFGTRYTPPK